MPTSFQLVNRCSTSTDTVSQHLFKFQLRMDLSASDSMTRLRMAGAWQRRLSRLYHPSTGAATVSDVVSVSQTASRIEGSKML